MAFANKSRNEIFTWIQSYLKAADSLTASGLTPFFVKDSTLLFANNPSVNGIDNIVAYFGSTFPLLQFMKHDIQEFDTISSKIHLSTQISYIIANDPEKKTFIIPAFVTLAIAPEGGELKISRMQVYVDLGPVFGRLGELQAAGEV